MFKVKPLLYSGKIPKYNKRDRKKYYFDYIATKDKFQKLFVKNLEFNLPTIYLEGFKDFLSNTLREIKGRPKFIITGIGIYTNERLKFLMAYCQEEYGTKLIGLQHGGLYGTSEIHSFRRYEKKIYDKWIKYGEENKKI